MNLEAFRSHCLSLPNTEETMPFGPEVVVYKVGGKMFALSSFLENPERPESSHVNLKCEPERAVELRDCYEDITPGYHMNKRHWNTLDLAGHLPEKLVRELIDHSYQLVVASLSRKARAELQ